MILVMTFPFPSATSALTEASNTLVGKPSVAHWMSNPPVAHVNARKIRVFVRSGAAACWQWLFGDKRQRKALSCGGKSVGLPSAVAARERWKKRCAPRAQPGG